MKTAITPNSFSLLNMAEIFPIQDIIYLLYDGRCHCCRKHESELEPVYKTVPTVKDESQVFANCIITLIPLGDSIKEVLSDCFLKCETDEDFQRAWKDLGEEYGEKCLSDAYNYIYMSRRIAELYLCGECILLDKEEFYNKFWTECKNIFLGKPYENKYVH
jgi:hypothetical protein